MKAGGGCLTGRDDGTRPGESALRVIVKTVGPPRKPYSWVVIDDSDGRVVYLSSDRFRTSALAWDAGVSFLAKAKRVTIEARAGRRAGRSIEAGSASETCIGKAQLL
jgi:hypothetical protein